LNALLIGGGGREHALAWKLKQSPLLDTLYCAPGNAGIAGIADCVALDVRDHAAVASFCKEREIGLVVIGPEAPLVDGLTDDLEAQGIKVFGPSQAATKLEGSKGFTKDLCARAGIPTASYARFSDARAAKDYLTKQKLPIVIKADGLAAGKGVTIADTKADAEAAIDACFSGAFGAAGSEVVIEEFLRGEEASFFALVDGRCALPLATAQDHKRAYDGDRGPNTGGMGAYSPAPIMTPDLCNRVMREIIAPTVHAMAEAGTPFKGVLYAGLMIEDGAPKLIEYNVRFGDPECQPLMLRLKSDLLPALLATAKVGFPVLISNGARSLRCAWSWQRKAIRALMPRAPRSRASKKPRASLAYRSSTPEPGATATAYSPMAAACSASPRGAVTSARRRRVPTRRWTRSTGRRLLPPRHRLACGDTRAGVERARWLRGDPLRVGRGSG
jgi:phosphoribosylamine--glycine ligase